MIGVISSYTIGVSSTNRLRVFNVSCFSVLVFLPLLIASSLSCSSKHLGFRIGDRTPTIELINSSGKTEIIRNNSREEILLCIFSRPCSSCNINLKIWNRLSGALLNQNDNIKIYGISVASLEEVVNLFYLGAAKFSLYIPKNQDDFIRLVKYSDHEAQTIAFSGGVVRYIKHGTLDLNDYLNIVKIYQGGIE